MAGDQNDDGARAAGAAERLERLEARIDVVERIARALPRIATAQFLLGLPAFALTLVIAYATYVQAQATREMQYASAHPIIQLDFIVDPAGLAIVRVGNVGVGPAVIRHWRAQIEETPITAASIRAGFPEVGEDFAYAFSSMQNRNLSPGSHVDALTFDIPAGELLSLADRLRAGDPQIRLQACYCSVFDQCWTVVQVVAQDNRAPMRDDACAL